VATEQDELPALTIDQILAWVDAHHQRAGKWAICHSGDTPEAPGDTWLDTEAAVYYDMRGFRAGSFYLACWRQGEVSQIGWFSRS
jgi:hypothetical protein